MRSVISAGLAIFTISAVAAADPPLPTGPHPRLFMSAQQLAAYTANANSSNSAAAAQVAACQDTMNDPGQYNTRGGSDGNYWPGSAVSCAFAYLATHQSQYLTQALLYWNASLNDDQTIGDGLGCVQGVDTNWQTWASSGSGSAPPVLKTVTHDTGYPMRWYGPDIALTYDWLYSAPGVTPALLAQTRTCLTNWIDWYSQYGYHHDQAGANYGAGYVISSALGAIAIGNDGGADGHLWTTTLDTVFQSLLIGQGLMGLNTGVGTPAGAMVGGDWLEGWEYGPLSVLEYAVAARALEDNGATLPEMDAWTNSLAVRYIYGTVPQMDGQWVGGDFDSSNVYAPPSANELDAVLAGPSSDQAASWALYMKQQQSPPQEGYVYNAIAELRTVAPQDYRAQVPVPPLWYLSHGSRAMYVRTAWDQTAFWGVFSSPPQLVDDHQHFEASNFVFSRGGDHLIVDSSEYGAEDTLETNAVSADSPSLQGDYAMTQTPWSTAELPWARASDTNVFAARSDFAGAFNWDGNPSDIPYAHREWVFFPEGEVVTIDRVHTADASHVMYVNFHANTNGAMTISGSVASGAVGGSQVAIHAVSRSGGTPSIQPPASISTDNGNCSGNYPNGSCNDARFNVDIYSLQVPGPYAMAIHAVDGLASGEAQATVSSMNDSAVDPSAQNGGVIGAAVYRNQKQNYVVATSAHDGATGSTMTYGVPGISAARHIVFDAPEASDGSSHVVAAVQSGRCVITITAGSGAGFTGHPLMFGVDTAANGCTATDSTNVGPATVPMGGSDAGTPPTDGGTVGHDGGTVIADAGMHAGDAGGMHGGDGSVDGSNGANPDGGTGTSASGCSCDTRGSRPAVPAWAFAIIALSTAALRTSRRRSRL